jgi:hypothetical protein
VFIPLFYFRYAVVAQLTSNSDASEISYKMICTTLGSAWTLRILAAFADDDSI